MTLELPRRAGPRLLAVLLASVVLGAAGCDGPCRSLAERVCECEPNIRLRNTCQQEIDANGNVRQPTSEEDDRCIELLETCTCQALERQDFAACGLTKPPRQGES